MSKENAIEDGFIKRFTALKYVYRPYASLFLANVYHEQQNQYILLCRKICLAYRKPTAIRAEHHNKLSEARFTGFM